MFRYSLSLLGRCGVNNIILSFSLFKMHARPAGVGIVNTMMMMTGRVNVRLRSARSLAPSN